MQRQAEQAAAAERARIARELHNIVAHHLSVVVLQAAGARASGKPAGPVLEKIENSARQALEETSRLLNVLRDPDEEAGLAPQPGTGELDALAASVQAAGLPVNLVIDGDFAPLPTGVDVSAYRIVQEALTNTMKHAGPVPGPRWRCRTAAASDARHQRRRHRRAGRGRDRKRPAGHAGTGGAAGR